MLFRSIEFDKCVKEMGYLNTPWDLKLFYKWISGKPLFAIAHSDDFRWSGSEDVLQEWDVLVKDFNATNTQSLTVRTKSS